jgi:hypothetical protein
MTRVARILLVAAALSMLGYRLVHIDRAAFARDEPQFLTAAREQLRTGHWLSASSLYGNMGLRYGPAAFWFYGAVQFLFGDDPRVAIVAMGLLITLAHLFLALSLTNLFAEGAVFFAVVLAWIASSPYQFYWSRLAWDLTSTAGVTCAVVLLCVYKELRPGPTVALGLALGVALSTHLMVAPLLVAVGGALAWELQSQPRRLAAVGALLTATVLAVNMPYILFLWKAPLVQRAPREELSLAALGSLVLETPRVATTWGLEYFFGGDWADFQAWLGAAARPASVVSVLALVVCAAGGMAGLVAVLGASDERQRRVGRTAAIAWAGSVLLLATLGLAHHPHYQFASAWVPLFGVAAGLAWLRKRSPRAGAAALAVLGAIAVAQFLVIVQWMGYIVERGGTRGGPYGTPIGLQIEAMHAVCSVPEPLIVLQNATAMYPFPFEYLATTETACVGKTVVLCASVPSSVTGRECPASRPEARIRRLTYATEKGGALRVD